MSTAERAAFLEAALTPWLTTWARRTAGRLCTATATTCPPTWQVRKLDRSVKFCVHCLR